MRQITAIIFLTCAFITKIKAQVNYVLNPSFEQYSDCPMHDDQIRFAINWNTIDTIDLYPYCAPEYYNTCDSGGLCSVPTNSAGYQYPRSGNAYSGGKIYFDESFPSSSDRDYTQGKLYKPLTMGRSYCVTFYVSLAEISEYAVNSIGAYLDGGQIDTAMSTCSLPQTSYTPQIVDTVIVNDTTNWVKVQGSFMANGNERFITIGNFFSKSNTSAVTLHYSTDPIGYYFVDDVSVIASDAVANAGPDAAVSPGSDSATIGTSDEGMPCTWYVLGSATPIGYSGSIKVHPDTTTSYVIEMDLCGNVTRDTVVVVAAPAGVGAISIKYANVQIYPNPATTSFTITHASGSELLITDVVGQQVYEAAVSSDKETIDIASLVKGVYLVQVVDITTGAKITKRVIKE